MRFRSEAVGGFRVYAVSGPNTISFAIAREKGANTKGLLGFAVQRKDPAEKEAYTMPGYKVFRSLIPRPTADTQVSTWDHPVQSFVWDDFTAKPGRQYQYLFHPMRGTPKNVDRSTTPIPITVRTEQLFSDDAHDVFFNRGVASSQAYHRKYGNKKPDDLPEDKQEEAFEWLTRSLDEAMFEFIKGAKKGDSLLCCFYEFRYLPIAEALAAASDRGVHVRIIIDAKQNGKVDKDGTKHPPFPRADNLKTIRDAGLKKETITLRDANPGEIQHNKFMVLLKGKKQVPSEVWTGSTNLSQGGLAGQTNVGHWVRDGKVATQYKLYWELIAENLGTRLGQERSASTKAKADYRKRVIALDKPPSSPGAVAKGVTPVFSPRAEAEVLDLYCRMVDSAGVFSAITLAFGINADLKKLLTDNTKHSHLVFMLLEKEDKPNKRSKSPFVAINARNNVYKAWGSYIKAPIYQWAKETNAKALALNVHVSYIHSKFLLMDPLSDDPIVVTGSANFSKASITGNDENMLIIRGSKRVADIYFTEFNRLFNHYYFRSVLETLSRRNSNDQNHEVLFLDETGKEWLKGYEPGKLRWKRVEVYKAMEGYKAG